MPAIILAGGQGKKMASLCYDRSKATLPMAGHYRVIDFTLSNCIHSGLNNIAVLVDYRRSITPAYLKRWHVLNAGNRNFRILEQKREAYRGTADTVYQHLELLEEWKGAESILILAADHVYKMDYRKMLAFHEQSRADVTIAVISVPSSQTQRFGILNIDDQNRVVDFVEKPMIPRSTLASMGVYVFNRNTLKDALLEDAAQQRSSHDFARAIIPKLTKQQRVFAYRFNDYWQDIGTLEAYYNTNIQLAVEPPLDLTGDWPILNEENNLPPAREYEGAQIVNSVVCPGCVIKGHVENSVLSPGVCIDEQAVVKNSVIMTNTYIGYHSVIDHSVLDESIHIGKYCYIGFGAARAPVESELTVLGKGVTVPPYTAIGRNCRVYPNVGPADFVTKTVPRDYLVSALNTLPRTLNNNKLVPSKSQG